ncbi:MAG: DNA-directed DNA polymerase II small subunit [Nanoarchaeota archaeon]|nr:DNA-directed DNA polymerase II small subunit [Nanoarchaeota archaeon]MBU1623272.1 DNA-directed DNA polymerase II small subunit [Nanoarchaeota archaeon]
MSKAEFVQEMFKRGFLVNQEILENELDQDLLKNLESENDLVVLNKDYSEIITLQTNLVNWHDLDKYRVIAEKNSNYNLYVDQLDQFKQIRLKSELKRKLTKELEKGEGGIDEIKESKIESMGKIEKIKSNDSGVKVIYSPKITPKKYTVQDFTTIFLSRYRFLESLLRNRQELNATLAINRLQMKKEREQVSVIGAVYEIKETRNGNIILTLEDPTGLMKVLISKSKKELYKSAKDLVNDEVIGVSGASGDKIIFADKIIWPEIPINNNLKKSVKEEYAIFLSDLHVGSKQFLGDALEKFLRWINGRVGDEKQRQIAEKVKYIFIAGDVVDGVGIYPSHEDDLEIKRLAEQYEEFSSLIKQIPTNKQIIISPGNHDGVHLAEPQREFHQEYAEKLFNIPNIILVANPAIINIGQSENFSGFNVLMYHGFSFDYYVSEVESIRMNGGYHRADLIMQFLLKRRHLAPAFTSTPYFPGYDEDPLLIKTIPDFFLSGHIHYCSVANYRGVTMICGSCWQGKTSFQEKLGHEPEPGRVPLVNLKTREVKILKFI